MAFDWKKFIVPGALALAGMAALSFAAKRGSALKPEHNIVTIRQGPFTDAWNDISKILGWTLVGGAVIWVGIYLLTSYENKTCLLPNSIPYAKNKCFHCEKGSTFATDPDCKNHKLSSPCCAIGDVSCAGGHLSYITETTCLKKDVLTDFPNYRIAQLLPVSSGGSTATNIGYNESYDGSSGTYLTHYYILQGSGYDNVSYYTANPTYIDGKPDTSFALPMIKVPCPNHAWPAVGYDAKADALIVKTGYVGSTPDMESKNVLMMEDYYLLGPKYDKPYKSGWNPQQYYSAVGTSVNGLLYSPKDKMWVIVMFVGPQGSVPNLTGPKVNGGLCYGYDCNWGAYHYWEWVLRIPTGGSAVYVPALCLPQPAYTDPGKSPWPTALAGFSPNTGIIGRIPIKITSKSGVVSDGPNEQLTKYIVKCDSARYIEGHVYDSPGVDT